MHETYHVWIMDFIYDFLSHVEKCSESFRSEIGDLKENFN